MGGMMEKSYADFMNEISADELYERLLAHGLFADKLPPIFSSVDFFCFCQEHNPSFPDDWAQYVYYENMRNINVPRALAIPNPMAYQKLCRCLADNWSDIQQHFVKQTSGQDHKISRIHIRKMKDVKSLFVMNYDNWWIDGNPEQDLLIGSKYIVKADISTCFPSIYTHSIPWAAIGKNEAKKHIGKKYKDEWYNKIDKCAQNCKNGETHGLLIGPHASNLVSEIILTTIDKKLYEKGWRYLRCIDDYTCYVPSMEKGKEFLVNLGDELRQFDLMLNYKKTQILELPIVSEEPWVRILHSVSPLLRNGRIDFIGARSYLDSAIELMKQNNDNSAILNYAMKVLSNQEMTIQARNYCIKTFMHLALIYPYLIPVLDKYLFRPLTTEDEYISSFSEKAYSLGLSTNNYEAICYSIYFSLKYNFQLKELKAKDAISSDSCLFKLFAYLYFKIHKSKEEEKALAEEAHRLSGNKDDFNRNWLFVYEVLSQNDLEDEWNAMKKANVSFIIAPFNKILRQR